MKISKLFNAIFGTKPTPSTVWYHPSEQPACNLSFLLINEYGGINTEIRIGTGPFEFNENDVSWCYLHQFKHLLPESLKCRVYDFMPGVNETKTSVVYEFDAGGSCYNMPGVLADWSDALVIDGLYDDYRGYSHPSVLADWDTASIINTYRKKHNKIFDVHCGLEINDNFRTRGNFLVVKFGYNAPGVQSDWDLAIYINNLKHVKLATELRMGALECELNRFKTTLSHAKVFLGLIFKNTNNINTPIFVRLRNHWVNGTWNE